MGEPSLLSDFCYASISKQKSIHSTNVVKLIVIWNTSRCCALKVVCIYRILVLQSRLPAAMPGNNGST